MDEEDLVLEEAQSKAYNPLLGKYNFKVDVAGVKSLKSPELEVLKKECVCTYLGTDSLIIIVPLLLQ